MPTMLRLLLPLLTVAILAAACGSEENIPTTTSSLGEGLEIVQITPSSTLTPGTAGDVIICPRIGIPAEATPSSPTPEPSCEPGDDFAQLAPNIRGRLSDPEAIPSGLVAATRFVEFETDDPDTGGQVGIPLILDSLIGKSPAWYSYVSGSWQKLDVVPTIQQSTDPEQQSMAESLFEPLPPNLILLAAQ